MWDQTEVDDDFLNALKCDPPVTVRSMVDPSRSDSPFFDPETAQDLSDRLAPAGYEILEERGRGGMGIVYKAHQRRLDRPIALKMLLAGNYAAPRELDRFRREAEAIARLQHPNIVQIHEIGEHEGRPYLALEYVEGDSLARHIDATPQSAIRSAQIVAILARAIHEAHCLGIIHRDLKPANVLLTAAGEPKITDFGLAKRLDDDDAIPTLTEQFMGTPSYMAPEQAVRERTRSSRSSAPTKATAAVDIYSLGAILYELLTGRPPFRAETPLETVIQVLNEEPVPPSRLRPNVPRDLETICLKCLEKSPQRRYGTALDLALDLARFLQLEPVKARPVSTGERLWRWFRRKKALAVAVILAVLAITTTIGLSISLAVHHYRAAHRLGELLQEVSSRQRQVDQQASHLAYEHGQTLGEQGDVAQGMLWLVRGLKNASVAHDADLERRIPAQHRGLAAAALSSQGSLRAPWSDPRRCL